ncbi:MAG: TPR end-of-group domain-containing protein [Acidithiobacillales bacterium]
MKSVRAALAALCFLPTSILLGQAPPRATPKPVPKQKESGGGVTVQAGPEAPKAAAPARIEDLRLAAEGRNDPFALERLGLGAAQANDLEKARTFFELSWKLGKLPTAAYNIACVDVREKRIDAAFASLDRALAAGFDDETALKRDPDLAPLRSSPRWPGVEDRAAKNRLAGDEAAVKEGLFIAPKGSPAAILVLLHDAASFPMAVSAPFVAEAARRGLFLAAPRGPGTSADRKFGWGSAERAAAAVKATVTEARRRSGGPRLPVFIIGVGRGGTEAFTMVAAKRAGPVAGVGSIGGPFEPGGAPQAAGLRGVRLFLGISRDADPARTGAFQRGIQSLRSLGYAPAVSEWTGTGDGFPNNPAEAVTDSLDALRVPAGR